MRRALLAPCLALLLASCGSTTARPTAAMIVARLAAAGLPVGQSVTYTAATDPNNLLGRPNGYTGKASFLDTRLARQTADSIDVADGGSVETFPNAAAAQARMTYIQGIAKGLPALTEYDTVAGAALLRLSARLTPDDEHAYQTAFTAAAR